MARRSPRWWRSATTGIVLAMLTAATGLLAVDSLFSLLEQGAEGGSGAKIGQALWSELPERVRSLLASALLLGAVWHLGERASHGELNALRTLGISSLRICLSAAAPAFLLAVAVFGAAEYLAAKQQEQGKAPFWSRHGEWVFYNTGCGRELQWWQLGPDALRSWGRAKTACFENDRWRMRDVRLWSADGSQTRQAEYTLSSSREAMSGRHGNVSKLSALQLWQTQAYLPPSRYKNVAVLEFWRRLLSPLQAALVIFVAALLPLGMVRGSKPGIRLVMALALAMGFRTAETLLLTLGQALTLPPALTALIPPMALLLLYPLLRRRVH